jgi:uncharacterized protein
VVEGKETEGAKFRDWFDFAEPIEAMPSHRALALLRGRNEGMLGVSLVLDSNSTKKPSSPAPTPASSASPPASASPPEPPGRQMAAGHRALDLEDQGVHPPRTGTDERAARKAEEEAIRVFGKNLKDLLLAAPAGQRVTMGLDPGIRTGCKVAVVDATGKLLDTATIYPHEPRRDWGRLLDHRPPGSARVADRHRQRHRQPRNRQAGAG